MKRYQQSLKVVMLSAERMDSAEYEQTPPSTMVLRTTKHVPISPVHTASVFTAHEHGFHGP